MAINSGGDPRYDIHNMKNFKGKSHMEFSNNVAILRKETQDLANSHRKILEKYIQKTN